jgi:hypothetical protein
MLHQVVSDHVRPDDDEGFIDVVRQVKIVACVHVYKKYSKRNKPKTKIHMMDTAQNEFNRRLHKIPPRIPDVLTSGGIGT